MPLNCQQAPKTSFNGIASSLVSIGFCGFVKRTSGEFVFIVIIIITKICNGLQLCIRLQHPLKV